MKRFEDIEVRYKALFQQAGDYILVLEPQPDGYPVIIDASDSALIKHGYTRDELIGQPISFIDHKTTKEDVVERLQALESKGQTTFKVEHICKDGSTFSAEACVKLVTIGGKDYLYAIERDITERREMEEALQDAYKNLEKRVKERTRELAKVNKELKKEIEERQKIEDAQADYTHYLECVNRISAILEKPFDVDEMLQVVLQELFDIFEPDRAFLLYPCDPDATSFRVPFEVTRPEYPGGRELNQDIPMNPLSAEVCAKALATNEVRAFPHDVEELPKGDPGKDMVEQFTIKSEMQIVLRPTIGKEWLLGLHQCSHTRVWADEEIKLFKGVSQNISNALSNRLLYHELMVSEQRFRNIFENSAIGLALLNKDWKIKDVNPVVCKMLGYTHDELINKTPAYFSVPDQLDGNVKLFEQLKTGQRDSFDIEKQYIHKNGTVFWASLNVSLLKSKTDASFYVIAMIEDISERKEAQEKLKLSANVFENAMEGVLVTDATGAIQYVNPSFTTITGFSSSEAIGQTPRILKSGKHEDSFYDEMWSDLVEKGCWAGEVWNRHPNGEPYLIKQTIMAIKNSEGDTIQYAAVFHDITDLKRSEEEIKYQAYHDVSTGLPNRTLFNDRLKQAVGRAKRDDEMMALLFLDVDDFKKVNDNFGHGVGDLLIQGIGMRLTTCIRDSDTVSRFAGDEFTIIMEGINSEQDVVAVGNKILKTLSEPYMYLGKKIHSTVSIGIALYPNDGLTPEELTKNADLAMYLVKDQTKNNMSFFTKSLNEEATRRHELEYKMLEALEKDQFIVHYQPKVSLATGKITSMEALVRWEAGGELISPAAFIPLAEETGLIAQIGEQVLISSCRQLQAWREMGFKDLSVSVNVSARQFEKKNLVEVVRSTLHSTGLAPDKLCIEVTETAIMRDMTSIVSALYELKSLGLKISLDDFGTGYSSLSHIRKFPISELKIDRFFIMSIPEDKDDSVIANMVIGMAQGLGLNVVAEGVENHAQLEFLRAAKCNEIQGYLFSRPLPMLEMEALLKKDKTFT